MKSLALALVACRASAPPPVANDVSAGPARDLLPSIDLVDERGNPILHDALVGHVVIVLFAGESTRAEIDQLSELEIVCPTYKARGVVCVAINYDWRGKATAGLSYPVVPPSPAVLDAYGHPGRLTTFVYDRAGHQAARRVGKVLDPEMRAILDPLVR